MLRDRQPPRRFEKSKNLYTLLCLATGLAVGCFFLGLWFGKTSAPPEKPVLAAPAEPPAPVIDRKVTRSTVQPGDTVTSLLGDIFTPRQIYLLNQSSQSVFPLSRLCAGQNYELCLLDGRFESFVYDIDREEQLVVKPEGDGFAVSKIPIEYAVKTELVTGTINSSLFEAVVASGEKEALAINLADIFAWDIDFIRDIQVGDSFEALVEKRYREGNEAGYGRILAARFTNQGQAYNAYLFQDGDQAPAYYDEKGRSVRKAFLKAPLSFSRISSGFNMRRLHPITKKVRPHPAIDYAAPTGTPIKTVADGTVTFAAYKRYNGNCVKVRHPGGWVTMYNHMSRFGRGIKKGVKVRQGQFIGYVGTTGRSTGPHLDFRMYKNGVAVNPLKVKSPPSAPVSSQRLASFKLVVNRLASRLDGIDTIQTAQLKVGNQLPSEDTDTLAN